MNLNLFMYIIHTSIGASLDIFLHMHGLHYPQGIFKSSLSPYPGLHHAPVRGRGNDNEGFFFSALSCFAKVAAAEVL